MTACLGAHSAAQSPVTNAAPSQGAVASPDEGLSGPHPETGQTLNSSERLSSISGPDIDDIWIVEMRLRRRTVLETDLFAYGNGEGETLFIPLLQLADSLDFAFEADSFTDNAPTQIDGFFIRESQTFSFDAQTGEACLGERTITVPPHLILVADYDVYLPLVTLSDWFQLGANWSRETQRIDLNPAFLLPQEEASRRAQGGPAGSSVSVDLSDFKRVSPEYALIDWPHVQVDSTLSLRSTPDGWQNIISGSAIASGDALGMNGQLFLSGTSAGNTNARLRLGRVDTESQLFGPLKATRFELGDIALSQAPLTQRAKSGVGLRIAKEPLQATGEFDRTLIEGLALIGWQAELYRGNELLGFQTIGPDGRYIFADVPLLFGDNRFRVELYGPQGQTETRLETVRIDNGQLRPGEINYRLEVLEADRSLFNGPFFRADDLEAEQNDDVSAPIGFVRGGVHAQGVMSVGLTRSLSLRGQAFYQDRETTRDGANLFSGVGTSYMGALPLVGSALLSADTLIDEKGGWASSLRLAAALKGFTYSLEREDYRAGFLTDANQLGRGDAITDRTRARLDGQLKPFGERHAIGVGLSLSEFNRQSGGLSRQATLRTSGRLRGLSLSHSLNYQTTQSADTGFGERERLNGAATVAGRMGPVRLRGGFTYDVLPDAIGRTLDLDADVALDRVLGVRFRRTRAGARIQHDMRSDTTSWAARISRDIEGFRIGADVRRARGEWDVLFRLGFAFDCDPASGDLRLGDKAESLRGEAIVRVYEDTDRDGRFGPDDILIPAQKIAMSRRGRQEAVDDGRVRVTGLSPTQAIGLSVDADALDDPFMVPLGQGQAISGRPGHPLNIDLPVVQSAELEVRVDKENTIATLESCESSNRKPRRYRERSAFDGLILFQFIIPGCYTLSVPGSDPQQVTLQPGITAEVRPRVP